MAENNGSNTIDPAKRIHTHKILNNGYFNGDGGTPEGFSTQIQVAPSMEKQYDYALTDDIVLLNERKDTQEKIYKIFMQSPWAAKYSGKDYSGNIDKEDVFDIFYYMKDKLLKVKKLSAYEYIIGILEFFDFNYDFIVKKVLSPKITCELLDDIYAMGIKKKIEENSAVKLF